MCFITVKQYHSTVVDHHCVAHVPTEKTAYASGEKIRKLLLEKGSFDKVEVVVKQWQEQKSREETSGGYVTKQWLMDHKSYTS